MPAYCADPASSHPRLAPQREQRIAFEIVSSGVCMSN
jgi:hypothetical protein